MSIPKRTGPETPTETFARWLSDGQTWIGVFENRDPGHPDMGRRIAMPFDVKDLATARTRGEATALNRAWVAEHREVTVIPPSEIQHPSHAPEEAVKGLGWRYLLIAKVRTVDEAEALMSETTDVQRSTRHT